MWPLERRWGNSAKPSRRYTLGSLGGVEAEYNAAVDAEFRVGNDSDAEFQVDDAIDIGNLLGGTLHRSRRDPWLPRRPTPEGESPMRRTRGCERTNSDTSSSSP